MTCLRCGSSIQTIHGFCSLCGGLVSQSSQQLSSNNSKTIPWESDLLRSSPLTALVNTIQESFFSADKFFAKVKNLHTKRDAWFFGLITGSIGIIVTFLWSLFIPDTSNSQLSTSDYGWTLLFAPFTITLKILFSTIYVHFFLALFRSKQGSLADSFRICSYAQSAFILNSIPVIGSFLAIVMELYLIITGIHHTHHISKFKAFIILLFPIVLLALVIFAVTIAAITIGIAGSGFSRSLLPF